MSMIVVNYDAQLRAAFAAGQASTLFTRLKGKGADAFLASIPRTYEDWIESRRNDPQIEIG